MKDFKSLQSQQVDINFKAFSKKLPKIIKSHKNEYALMRDSEIIKYFSSFEDAYKEGLKLYKDKLFSIQEVTDTPVDLGFFSHALFIK